MKKILMSVFVMVALVGCSSYYDYYRGGIAYTQDGDDCIYSAGEEGTHFSSDIRSLNTNKKIVYRNTRCADLYARDNGGFVERADRQILVPAVKKASCGCGACSRAPRHSRYVLVSE